VWCNERAFAHDPKGRGFKSRPVHFQVTALAVHRDQLRAQRSETIMEKKLYLYFTAFLLKADREHDWLAGWGLTALLTQFRSYCEIQGRRKVRKRIAVCATSTAQLRELTCHMGSQCYLPPGRGDIQPLPQPVKAGTRFRNPRLR